MYTKFLTAATALASLSYLAMAADRFGVAAPNEQACTARNDAFFLGLDTATYNVNIGVPFNGDAGCSFVEQTLSDAVGPDVGFEGFTCIDGSTNVDGSNTNLAFTLNQGHGAAINAGLTKVFPNINDGFNCPDF